MAFKNRKWHVLEMYFIHQATSTTQFLAATEIVIFPIYLMLQSSVNLFSTI